ncbi:MAG: outer membrane beta-barrel protein [Bacteroidetes bacterium]|nr:outer membrane beta-barrel protein [Bacteroidota bacterium]MBK8343370.1 outer membrane beta-barrel protein [Bacteroidota bacterium]
MPLLDKKKFIYFSFKSIRYVVVVTTLLMFTHSIIKAQNPENALVFSFSPGVSTTLPGASSDFDKKYFYAFSPHLGVSTELLYQQVLNKKTWLSTGLGFNFNKYAFYHTNFTGNTENEVEGISVGCFAIKIPLLVKYQLNVNHFKGDIYTTFGADLLFIHGYSESIYFSGGNYASGSSFDSTLYATYPPFAPNANLRIGVEVDNLFDSKNINFNATLVYQLIPYSTLNIINTVKTTSGEIVYQGSVSPTLLTLFIGIHIPIITDI